MEDIIPEERKSDEARDDGSAGKLMDEIASFPPDFIEKMFERAYNQPVSRFDLQLISYRITDIFTPLFEVIIELGGDRPEVAQKLAKSASGIKRFQNDIRDMIHGTLTGRSHDELVANSTERHAAKDDHHE